ncbi:hypothetical protein [Mycobacterium spongiae]|uniref:Uncharacterized protein n=1 Tax=Mycobacterium spongiae TaxID=886343 RepID=A0A975PVU4_9MYCO|nr:hypothetical protein [Mycobacterium spongiae]QUR66521.1 hypothetical protein F6B93_04945 [Mycobacterium spongiae]
MRDMTVDSIELAAAGATLRELIFPEAPPPVISFGWDDASEAINEVIPPIYAMVTDGLLAAKAALTTIGSDVATAAQAYADTDRTLGGRLSEQRF